MSGLIKYAVAPMVDACMKAQAVVDMHTHLYPPSFDTPVANASGRVDPRGLMLWGIDELVTYHYLVAEVFRVVPAGELPYEQFWKFSKREQADHIWKWLFVERSPISEACQGVVTTLTMLGLDPNVKSLDKLRPYFAQQHPDAYIDKVLELAKVSSITMTNAVFDDAERERWLRDANALRDPRFPAVLRIDPLLVDPAGAMGKLAGWGYAVDAELGSTAITEAQRFLRDWIDRMKPIYLAASLPPEFRYPAGDGLAAARAGQTMLAKVILPVCAERGLPFAMMIGARRGANPALRDGADMGGVSDVQSIGALCREFPKNRFFVTMLARENQHELCVAARKFGNLIVFGCWWFLNNPSLIREMTAMRLELLGTSFIPQHSDARVLEQIIYKWSHSRRVIGEVLGEKYQTLADAGFKLGDQHIERDVRLLLRENFRQFVSGRNPMTSSHSGAK